MRVLKENARLSRIELKYSLSTADKIVTLTVDATRAEVEEGPDGNPQRFPDRSIKRCKRQGGDELNLE